MIPIIASVVIVVTSCLWLAKQVQPLSSKPLSKIPNLHFTSPYTRLWQLWLKGHHREHQARLDAHRNLGPIIRVGPNELSLDCIDDGVKKVYGGSFEKGSWYSKFETYNHDFLFIMQSNKDHSERKRMLSHVYSNSYIQTSEALSDILHEIIFEKYTPQIKHWAEQDAPIDMFQENKAVYMDLTSAFLFGLGNGSNFVENPEEKAHLRTFELAFSAAFWLLDASSITKWLNRLGYNPIPAAVPVANKSMENLNLMWCARSKASLSDSPPGSYPTVYAQLKDKIEASGHVPEDKIDTIVASELLDHIAASHEILAIITTFLMYELGRNNDVLARLQQEILSIDLDTATATQIDALPVLEAALQETLRLYPSALGPFTRIVPDKGATLAGYEVPGGTLVAASAFTLHLNPDVFPSPSEWIPDRWLEASPERMKEMKRWFWAWGSGGRMCIGKHFAIRMMKMVIVAVYKDFETVVVPETDIRQAEKFIAHPVNHSVMLGVKRRE